MCSRWKATECALQASVDAAGARRFQELAARAAPGLACFADARTLLAFLHASNGSDDERDRLLADLVTATQRRDGGSALARDILWLALWPGLTALHRRIPRWLVDTEDDVAAEVADKFTLAIDRLDLSGCSKVAATLIWNTQRQVYAGLRVSCFRRSLEQPFDEEAEYASVAPLGAEVVNALIDLEREAGRDADLVLSCVVEGLTTREMASRCGSAREAVKKRVQRILDRLRADDAVVPDRRSAPLIRCRGRRRGEEAMTDESRNGSDGIDAERPAR